MISHYDPNQPRRADGQWTDAGAAIKAAASDGLSKNELAVQAGGTKTYQEGLTTVKPGELGKGIKTNDKVLSLKEEIKNSGEVEPISIATDGFIVDGEHRYKALMLLGVKEIPVFVGIQEGSAGRLETNYNGMRIKVIIPK